MKMSIIGIGDIDFHFIRDFSYKTVVQLRVVNRASHIFLSREEFWRDKYENDFGHVAYKPNGLSYEDYYVKKLFEQKHIHTSYPLSMIYAIMANDYARSEKYTPDPIKVGNRRILLSLCRSGVITMHTICRNSIINGNLGLVKWCKVRRVTPPIHDTSSSESLIDDCIITDKHLEIVKYLHETYNYIPSHTSMLRYIYYGNIQLVQWCLQFISPISQYAQVALERGHIEIFLLFVKMGIYPQIMLNPMQWDMTKISNTLDLEFLMSMHNHISYRRILWNIALHGTNECITWIMKNYPASPLEMRDYIRYLMKCGCLEKLKCICENTHFVMDQLTICEAVSRGHVDICEYFSDKFAFVDYHAIYAAERAPEMISWFIKKGVHFTKEIIRQIMVSLFENEHWDIFQELYDMGFIPSSHIFLYVWKVGAVHILDKITTYTRDERDNNIRDGLILAVSAGNLDAVKFMIDDKRIPCAQIPIIFAGENSSVILESNNLRILDYFKDLGIIPHPSPDMIQNMSPEIELWLSKNPM